MNATPPAEREELRLCSARLSSGGPLVDVLVRDGRVAEITPADPSRRPRDPDVDLHGRWLRPGLWDHHVHFDQWAQARRRIDLAGSTSAAAVARLVAEHLAARRTASTASTGLGAELIVGYGFRDALWPDLPERALLDSVSGGQPSVMVSGDLHCAWLNSAALRRFGHPVAGTGLLREAPAMRVLGQLSQLSAETSDALAREAGLAAAARGVVGIVDLEKPWTLAAWTRRIAAGNRLLRVESAVWPESLDEAIAGGLRSGQLIEGADGRLRVGPLKVIIDGSLNTRTAYCHQPYVGSADTGLLTVSGPELKDLMRRASEHGLRCAIHAIGDRANSLALQAFAETGARGSIEHAQLLDRADVARFAELDVTASVQPEHAMDDREVADRLWAGRTDRAFMLRGLLAAGATVTLGSDAPVAPLDPWVSIAAAVTRARDDLPPWHPEQRITVGQALGASSYPGQRGRAGLVGVSLGAPADLMVLQDDPFTADPATLRSMPVAATMIGGEWTHRAGI